MLLCKKLNNYMGKLLHPEIQMLSRTLPSFKVLGYSGLALAILLTMILVTHLNLSHYVMAGLILAAILTFLGLAMATKIIVGEERLIYYHQEIAVMAVTAVLLRLLHQPVLPYLDVMMLGLGLFLGFGRIGCLMVGCCHGRPHNCGITYRKEHSAAGFTPYFVGVRLFPIQAIESLWVLFIVLVGTVLVLDGYPPGEALAWYVIAYGIGRFCFEFMRGDPDRLYLLTFSEAQWTSLILMSMVIWIELSGNLPYHLWHAGAVVSMVITMITVYVKRRFQKTGEYKILHPDHIKEIAQVVEKVSIPIQNKIDTSEHTQETIIVPIAQTSLGIQISVGTIDGTKGRIFHYALSNKNGDMSEDKAKTLSSLILQLRHPSNSSEVIKGNRGVLHLLVHPY